MKHQKLTENEARRLGEAIAAEARALGFVGKEKKMPKEIKRRIRARVLKGEHENLWGNYQIVPANSKTTGIKP